MTMAVKESVLRRHEWFIILIVRTIGAARGNAARGRPVFRQLR